MSVWIKKKANWIESLLTIANNLKPWFRCINTRAAQKKAENADLYNLIILRYKREALHGVK